MSKLNLLISILIILVGYKSADCLKCKYEAFLFGLMYAKLINYGTLGLEIILIFIIGEILIKYFVDSKK